MKFTEKIGATIKIFLPDGSPEGIRIISKSNWTGTAVMANRSQLSSAINREELAKPGVYVLTGTELEGSQKIYIGQSDNLKERLKQHTSGKDFWDIFVAFSCTDGTLNTAHVRFLEYQLIKLAKKANQWDVDNTVDPKEPRLSESDKEDSKGFLAEMLLIFPILGIDAFEQAKKSINKHAKDLLFLSERGAKGKGQEADDGFVVLTGSQARAEETASIQKYLSEMRQQLLSRQVLKKEKGVLVFTQDYRFKSPSTAAGVLVGGAANGRLAWKDRDNKTLRDIQEERVASDESEGYY